MFEIIKSVIENKDYELRDILYKINKMWIESQISEEEKTSLDELARENAKAENSYASLQEQVDTIFTEIELIHNRLDILEGTEEPTKPVEEYPEYVQPTGAHNCYNTGAKITFKGEKYTCLIDGCVWSPEEYPQGWKKETVEEVVEETVESEG